ncbi:MAG: SRPBCC domain-containing protein [Desulfomonilaceae bacterium]
MTTRNSPIEDSAERVLVITRILDAPRSLVFKVWTKPEHMMRWLGPRDFTVPTCEMDFRPGGTYRSCIRSPEGKDYWMRGVYREIVEPDRIVFTFAWEDEKGEPGHGTLVTVTFAEQDGRTKLTFHQAVFESISERDSHREGWSECFDRLKAYLAEL